MNAAEKQIIIEFIPIDLAVVAKRHFNGTIAIIFDKNVLRKKTKQVFESTI